MSVGNKLKKLFAWPSVAVLLTLGCLLASLGQFFDLETYWISVYILVPATLAAVCALLYTAQRPFNIASLILAALYCWYIAVSLLRGDISQNIAIMYCQAAPLLLCFPLPARLEPERRQRAYRLAALCVCAVTTVICAYALVVVVTGRFALSATFGLVNQRLQFCCNPNITGQICMICALLCIYLACAAKKWWQRAALAVAALLQTACMALSDSRTAMVGFAAAVGVIALRGVWGVLHKKNRILAMVCAALVIVPVAAAVYRALPAAVKGLNAATVSVQTGGETTSVYETDQTVVLAQSRQGDTTVNARFAIWSEALKTLRGDARMLVLGNSPGSVMNAAPSVTLAHMHNSFLQLLCGGGIPALFLALAFLALLCRDCWRLMFASEGADALLPALVLALVCCACFETFLFVGYEQRLDFTNMYFFLTAGYVAAAAPKLRSQKIL